MAKTTGKGRVGAEEIVAGRWLGLSTLHPGRALAWPNPAQTEVGPSMPVDAPTGM